MPETNAVQDLPPPSERNPLALARFNPDVRDALDTLVMRCLEQRPARRYRTARDLQSALRKLRE